MTNGVLGKATVVANTPTAVYTVPSSLTGISVGNISIVNTDVNNSTNIVLKINGTIIESNTFLDPSTGIGRSCGVMSPGDVVEVTSTNTSVDVVVTGVETPGLTGGSLAAAALTSGQNVQYAAPDANNASYVLVDFNVVNTDTVNPCTFNVTVDGTLIESNSTLPTSTGVFRAVGPISPSSIINVICVTGTMSVRISGRIF